MKELSCDEPKIGFKGLDEQVEIKFEADEKGPIEGEAFEKINFKFIFRKINYYNNINYEMTSFKKEDNINLFDGAFTWHWHNKWNDNIEEGSKFEILEKITNENFIKLIS